MPWIAFVASASVPTALVEIPRTSGSESRSSAFEADWSVASRLVTSRSMSSFERFASVLSTDARICPSWLGAEGM